MYELKKGNPTKEKHYKYPVRNMEVGDMFEAPYKEGNYIRRIIRSRNPEGKIFRIQRISKDTCGVYRIK